MTAVQKDKSNPDATSTISSIKLGVKKLVASGFDLSF